MTRVDPADDNIRRYVVRRYGYDLERLERRHQVVAAFDNEGEFSALIDARKEEVDRQQGTGDELSPNDYYSGVILEPATAAAWPSSGWFGHQSGAGWHCRWRRLSASSGARTSASSGPSRTSMNLELRGVTRTCSNQRS
jgi:hypothetical protein